MRLSVGDSYFILFQGVGVGQHKQKTSYMKLIQETDEPIEFAV